MGVLDYLPLVGRNEGLERKWRLPSIGDCMETNKGPALHSLLTRVRC